MKKLKLTMVSTISAGLLAGCAGDNQPSPGTQGAVLGTAMGAIVGTVLGNNIGGGSKKRNRAIGAAIGGVVGGVVGYNIKKQAKEVAQSLNTDVNNNPQAVLDPNQDLIVSSTDRYVKVMFRDKMMFATNSAVPTPMAQSKVQKVSSVLTKYPDTIVQVVGFTDNRGTYEYNKKLSDQRAANVANTLYSSNIQNKIFSKGCSYNNPVAPNTDATNMALNRRVEIYLYPNAESVIDVCR